MSDWAMVKSGFQTEEFPRFSRGWWASATRNFVWVGLVTLLIWIYADMEVADIEKITVTIRLTTSPSSRLMVLSEPEHRVSFKVRGPRAALERFTGKYDNSQIRFDVSKSYDVGKEQGIPVEDVVREAIPEIVELGLDVLSPAPATITGVDIDRRVQHEVRVELVYINAELESEPTATVRVSAAESQWARIIAKDPSPVLKTVPKDLGARKTGEAISVSADIVPLIGDVEVVPDSKSINVTVVVKRRTGEKRIPVLVRVVIPVEWVAGETVWKEYRLKQQDPLDWRREILVSGPISDLDRLDPGRVDAYIVLTDEDRKPLDSWLTREVIVRFPKDMNLKISEAPTVQFKLEKLTPKPPPTVP